MIPMTAPGNPAVIAQAINWSGAMISHHAVLADSVLPSVKWRSVLDRLATDA